uniref:Zona pellucida sperm-binding protein 4 n=1 Tax=Sparus aurata TaxID=8175 RepID=A0A671XPK0_SPAAU
MAKHWNTATLVALALLGCFIGTGVEAQGWPKPQPPTSPQNPYQPQVSPPQPPTSPQNPYRPQVSPPQPPTYPQDPYRPQVSPPQPPTYPQDPYRPQVSPPQPPTYPQDPYRPQVSPPQPPTYPQDPYRPQVSPPQPPTSPQDPYRPQVSPPQPPTSPQDPYRPQVSPPQPPTFPQNSKQPKVSPPQPPTFPQYSKQPKVSPPQPPTFPQYSKQSKVSPPQPPTIPQIFHDQSPQEPQVPQHKRQQNQAQSSSIYKPSGAKQPPVQSCEVASNMRIPCGHNDISAAGCEAINCCFNGQQCYFGKAVTVQCTKDAQFIVVVARDATLPNIDLESISLLGQGQGCTHVDSNSEFAIYQFPVTGCGSVVMEEPGVIIYENRMSSAFEVQVGDFGAITRDSSYELLFQCRYTGLSVETLVVEVLPLQDPPLPVAALGPISVHLRLANGQCNTKGCNEVSAAYTSFYTETDYPVVKVLRDPVYVEVLLLDKTDPALVLTLGHCWTTTSPNPHSLPQWDILIDGCPNRDDRYLSQLVPVDASSGLEFPGHFRRFIFKMFTFVDNSKEPLREQVYIHCSTAVCSAAPGRNCEPSCHRKGKRAVKAEVQRPTEPKAVVSVGPVIMSTPEE